jgi:hypothetical protein
MVDILLVTFPMFHTTFLYTIFAPEFEAHEYVLARSISVLYYLQRPLTYALVGTRSKTIKQCGFVIKKITILLEKNTPALSSTSGSYVRKTVTVD